ncbi:MAG: hypothetical protein ACI8RD_014932 [Bacillariaceae sp.]|jgi:hypothetical protein
MSAVKLDTNTYEHIIAVNPSILFFTIISSSVHIYIYICRNELIILFYLSLRTDCYQILRKNDAEYETISAISNPNAVVS